MAEQMPRASDYPDMSADQTNTRYGLGDWSENVAPYGTAARTSGGPDLRGVEANTDGRASRTPDLTAPNPAPSAPEPGLAMPGTGEPYGNQLGPIGQGGMNRVP